MVLAAKLVSMVVGDIELACLFHRTQNVKLVKCVLVISTNSDGNCRQIQACMFSSKKLIEMFLSFIALCQDCRLHLFMDLMAILFQNASLWVN